MPLQNVDNVPQIFSAIITTISSLARLATYSRVHITILIECDPSVKAIILKYDEERHDYIVEDLDDDRHLVIKESQLQNLKIRLGRELDEKVMQPEESESDE
ncbi:unnamed protein product [Aspergillus oryzae RIB40]|uniref:General transcription and DNA repair factor IIH subunit TFB5 n=1 Tax=Aspergillus oryzae (strain ATCC 42149 / RIB 40) TaxID=510516 RepID=Q2U864_ASPOR|nr:unnamed protein product [Aspergillus oryzae RIB40]BAE62251.1 unnamed protein product [Aspergillus oryzae RIB40]